MTTTTTEADRAAKVAGDQLAEWIGRATTPDPAPPVKGPRRTRVAELDLGARLAYKPAEVAKMLGYSVRTIHEEINEGRLAAVKMPGPTVRSKGPDNRATLVLHDDLVAWWHNWDELPIKARGDVTYPVQLAAKVVGMHHATLYRHLDTVIADGVPTERTAEGQIVVRHQALVDWLDAHRVVKQPTRPIARRAPRARKHAAAGASDGA